MSFEGTPRFELVRRLGTGGMGTVFEAFDRERGLPVAVKVIKAEDPETLMRFKREFRSVASIHHPNLVSLGELFAQDDLWFFTMELVRGVDILAHVRVSDGRFDLARLRAAFHQLGLGLAALHRHGHIHRDIKPSNVLVTPENRVVLLDFGLVREPGPSRDTATDLVAGTPEYMAPEQAMGHDLGPACDWYAVGVLLYEALTGEPPFSGSAMSVMIDKQIRDPIPPGGRVDGVPADVDALCMALLRRDPARRPVEGEILKRLYVELRRDDRTYLTLPLQPAADRFVGRWDVLSSLRKMIDEAAAGQVRLAFVTGAWGIGKTALVRELARQLSVDGRVLVWSGRCHEREAIPFKAADLLIDDAARWLMRAPADEVAAVLPADVALLARTFPVLQRVPAIAQQPAEAYDTLDPPDRRELLFSAARALVRNVAARRPLVVIVEDLQWGDADGLALLRAILGGVDEAPLAFVGTLRADDAALQAPAALVDGLDGAPPLTLHLGPLDDGEMIGLVDALLPDADEATIERVVTQAAGQPLFARELCLSRGALAGGLAEALRARIRPLPAPARALLEIVAVCESALPQALAAEVAGVEWVAAERAISHLRAAQLLRTVGLRRTDLVEVAHDRVRDAVLGALLPPALRALHQRIATGLETWPRASVETLAAHWIGAGQPRRAVHLFEAGAARAVEALAFERAAALYEQALRLCDERERPAIQARAAAAATLRRQRGA